MSKGQNYYLRFVAVNINKNNKRNHQKMNYSNNLLVKMVLQRNGKTIAEMNQATPTQAIQNTISILNAYLDLTVNTQQLQQNWQLLIMGRQVSSLNNKNQRLDLSQAESSGRKQMKKLGQCQINPYIYCEVFDQSHKTKFQQNISISKQLSLDYQVYIHTSRLSLEQILTNQSQNVDEPVDTAFKKRPGGSKKIRYVQLIQNRQASMNSSQFSISKKPKIQALKKSGAKFIPIKKDNVDVIKVAQDRIKPREYHQQRKIKPLPSQGRQDRLKKTSRQQTPRYKLSNEQEIKNRGQITQKSQYSLWPRIFILLILLLVAGYMMFPRRKI